MSLEGQWKSPQALRHNWVVEDIQMIRIKVSPAAKEAVEAFADKYDMSEQGVASRFYMWFAQQPDAIQKWVCGITNLTEREGARQFIEQLQADIEKAKPVQVKRHADGGGSIRPIPKDRPAR